MNCFRGIKACQHPQVGVAKVLQRDVEKRKELAGKGKLAVLAHGARPDRDRARPLPARTKLLETVEKINNRLTGGNK